MLLQWRRLTAEERGIWRRLAEKEKEDHLQKAGLSGLSFARGQSTLMIIFKMPVDPEDNLQEAS